VGGEIDDFRDAFSHLGGRLRLPFAQPGVQLFDLGPRLRGLVRILGTTPSRSWLRSEPRA
jgi:hypothetical protein